MSGPINTQRDEIKPGDIPGAVKMIVGEYEEPGDVIFRIISLDGRIDEIDPLLASGRKGPGRKAG